MLKEISIKGAYLEAFLWFMMFVIGFSLGENSGDGTVEKKEDSSMERN